MRPSLVSHSLFLTTVFISSTSALLAQTNSPCAVQCGNVLGGTSGDDIVCYDSKYGSSTGTTFSNCITCQLSSTYIDPNTKHSDVQDALYNLRYAISWCLFGYPNNPSVGDTPCQTSFACGPMQSGFELDSLSTNSSTYKYCALFPDVNVPKCSSCLALQTDEFYLSNFMTALNGGCLQQPTPGNTISLEGSLFSTTATNITTPSATPKSTNSHPTGGLTLGAKVAIAVSALLLVLAIAGFCIVCTGRRRRRKQLAAHQRETGYADWIAEQQAGHPDVPPSMSGGGGGGMSAGGFYDSPQSQRPLFQPHGWAAPPDESPASAIGEKVYFSPYSSQYSSPISAHDQVQVVGREWPMDRKGSVGGQSGLGRSRSTEKRALEPHGDKIEMQNVAPVLLHPGNGRNGGLTEDDARRGQAL